MKSGKGAHRSENIFWETTMESTIFLVDDNSSSSCAGGGDDDYHYLDACFLCKRDITSTATSSCTMIH
ncbi:hypothetical protein OsI_21716 [Oryza sativa Indica Group]|uniref:Uncharacterized protein n=1 Tax=Oryza sativa subsp. indica TaxID=39946 RepID=B8B2Z3_ORYSI|nr:hypothetical protein OsI_21716 [Oryza sativa Indica Group]